MLISTLLSCSPWHCPHYLLSSISLVRKIFCEKRSSLWWGCQCGSDIWESWDNNSTTGRSGLLCSTAPQPPYHHFTSLLHIRIFYMEIFLRLKAIKIRSAEVRILLLCIILVLNIIHKSQHLLFRMSDVYQFSTKVSVVRLLFTKLSKLTPCHLENPVIL